MRTVGLYVLDLSHWRFNHPDFEKKDIKMKFVISLSTNEDILIDLSGSGDCLGEYITAEEIHSQKIKGGDILCSEIVEVKPSMENEPIFKQLRDYTFRHKLEWEQMLLEKEKHLKLKFMELRKKELESDFE